MICAGTYITYRISYSLIHDRCKYNIHSIHLAETGNKYLPDRLRDWACSFIFCNISSLGLGGFFGLATGRSIMSSRKMWPTHQQLMMFQEFAQARQKNMMCVMFFPSSMIRYKDSWVMLGPCQKSGWINDQHHFWGRSNHD